MADAPDDPDNEVRPHPSARVIAEALAGISCVVAGELVGTIVRDALGLLTYTPPLFVVLSLIVLPPIARRFGYRLPPKQPKPPSAGSGTRDP